MYGKQRDEFKLVIILVLEEWVSQCDLTEWD